MLGSGNYLKTEDVASGDRITIKEEGSWVESTMYKYEDGNPKVDFNTKVDFKGEEKSVRINKTNRETLIAAYGNDTAGWVGRQVILTKEKVMVGGKKLDTLVYEIPSGAAPTEELPTVDVDKEELPF